MRLTTLAIGVAAGYTLARAIEFRAAGLNVDSRIFKFWVPVATYRAQEAQPVGPAPSAPLAVKPAPGSSWDTLTPEQVAQLKNFTGNLPSIRPKSQGLGHLRTSSRPD